MFGNTSKQILDGSRCYRALSVIARESIFAKALLGIRDISIATACGSRVIKFIRLRIVPVFLVGDYLEQRLDFKPLLLENSRSWARLANLLEKLLKVMRWGNMNSILSGSIAVNALTGREYRAPASPHRQAMALIILFVLLFYPLRQMLLLLFPGGEVYSGWTSGIGLALLLTAVYLLLSKRADSDAQ